MIKYDNTSALISIHIPKCGGSSFLTLLRQWFGSKLKQHYFNEKTCEMPIKYDLVAEGGICIHGHFNRERGFGIKDYYPDAKQFITMLRDPFEIAISNFFYIKRTMANNTNYRDGKLYYVDELAKYLKKYTSFMLLHMPCEITVSNLSEVIETKFVYIGVVEDMQASVDSLADKLDKPRLSICHDNISDRDEVVPIDFKEEFVKRNPVEYAMYEYVSKHYAESSPK